MWESVGSLLRLLSEGGWRLGVPLFAVGAALLIAHRVGFPEPGVLAPYLGWITIAAVIGVGILLVSLMAGIVTVVKRHTALRRSEIQEEQELKANVGALSPQEFVVLANLLQSGARRLKVHLLSEAFPLVEKRVLYRLDFSGTEPMCEVPKILRIKKDEIIKVARAMIDRGQVPPGYHVGD